MKGNRRKAATALLSTLNDSNVLVSLIKGAYFTKSELSLMDSLLLEVENPNEAIIKLIEETNIYQIPNRNQLYDKLLRALPLQSIEYIGSNSSFSAQNLEFVIKSGIYDYLSRTDKRLFNNLITVEKNDPKLNSFESVSLSQYLLNDARVNAASFKLESIPSKIIEFKDIADRVAKFYEVAIYRRGFLRHFSKSATIKPEYIEESEELYHKYLPWLDDCQDIGVFHEISQLGILHALMIPDYFLVISRCQSTIDGILKFEYPNNSFIRSVRYRLIEAYLQVEKYEEALEEHSKIEKTQSVFNRVRYYSLQIQIYFRLQRYQDAVEIYGIVDTTYHRSQISEGLLYNLDLIRNQILIITSLLDLDQSVIPSSRSLRRRLHTESPFYTDKTGLNLAQMVTKWILLIMDRDTDHMESIDAALNKYLSRHLKEKDNYRAKCMLRMLRFVYQSNYHVPTIKIRSRISYNRLRANPLSNSLQAMELEMINYQVLWNLLLDYLAAGKRIYD